MNHPDRSIDRPGPRLGRAPETSAESGTDHEEMAGAITGVLRRAVKHPVPAARLQKDLSRAFESPRPSRVLSILDQLVAEGVVLSFGDGNDVEFYLAENLDSVVDRLCSIVRAHHRKYPYEPGIKTGDIRKQISKTQTMNAQRNIDSRLFARALSACDRDGLLVQTERGWQLPDFEPLTSEDEEVGRLEQAILDEVASLPHVRLSIEELPTLLGADKRFIQAVVSGMLTSGKLVRIKADRYYTRAMIDEIEAHLAAEFDREPRLRLCEITTLLGVSRSVAIPLMEYLDSAGFTRRRGDYRERVREAHTEPAGASTIENGRPE